MTNSVTTVCFFCCMPETRLAEPPFLYRIEGSATDKQCHACFMRHLPSIAKQCVFCQAIKQQQKWDFPILDLPLCKECNVGFSLLCKK